MPSREMPQPKSFIEQQIEALTTLYGLASILAACITPVTRTGFGCRTSPRTRSRPS